MVIRFVHDDSLSRCDRRLTGSSDSLSLFQTDVVNIETSIREEEDVPARDARREAMGQVKERITGIRREGKEVERRIVAARVSASLRLSRCHPSFAWKRGRKELS